MRTVKYRDDIVMGVATLLSLDGRDLRQEKAEAIALRVNSWVRKGCDYWQWRELQLTEERAFREVLSPLLTYRAGQEGYFLTTKSYYRALVNTALTELPDTTPAKWEAITLLDRYISFDQFGKQSIGKVIEMHQTNPRTYVWANRVGYTLSGSGIDLVSTVGPTVWLTYQVRQPMFTHLQYDATKAYVAGDLAYMPPAVDGVTDPGSGECYRALLDGTGEAVYGNPVPYWLMQQMPYLLSEYVQYGVASDLAEDRGTKRDYKVEAEERLIREVNNEEEQGVYHSYSLVEQELTGGWDYTIPYALVEVAA